MHETTPIVIALQETMMGNSKIPCPKDYLYYHTSYNPNIGHHGGALLYIRHDIPHVKLQLQSELQAVAVQIHLDRIYTVCSIYLPPGDQFPVDLFESLIRELPRPFLILGDMNARDPLWGDIISNRRGNQLSSIVEDFDLGILNTGEPTHFHIQNGTLSSIDLSLCSQDSIIDFGWEVIDDRHTSDHFPIIINLSQSPPVQRLPKWNIDRANWGLYKEKSSINVIAQDFPYIDDAIDLLNTTLFTAGLQTIPRSTGMFIRRPVPWWNAKCKVAHRTMRTAKTRYRRHNSCNYKIEYHKARAQFRLIIKKSRKNCWSIFLSSINAKTPLILVWKKVRKISGKFVPSKPPVLKINNEKIAEPQVVADTMANHFAEVSKKDDNKPFAEYRRKEEEKQINFTSLREESYNLPFSMREFESALASCKESAPGPDDILYCMVKHAAENTKVFILSIINRIFIEHCFPFIWETLRILPFVKPGKDSFLTTSYRPIALSSCLCKIMEKMVNSRLMWYLERNNYLSPAQSGFRNMRSTTDALIQLESSICKSFALKQHHITIFFDLEKAYDTTWRYGILKELYEIELRGELPKFIQCFLKTRRFQVQIGATLSCVKVQEDGVPQGSVLSATLFALSINGIAKIIPKDILYTLFVDDLSISFAASRMSVVERKLQLTINKVIRWAEMRGFKFSMSKTVCMHFCRIRGVHPDPDLFINEQRISCVKETKFLGLIFDNKLNWNSHLKYLKTKCMK